MTTDTLTLIAGALATLGALLLFASLFALFRLRLVSATVRFLSGALLLAFGLLFGTLALGVHGYRALTHESLAARITLTPLGPQRFTARFDYPEGTTSTYTLAGDEIYVDARVIKWTPWGNVLGLHTSYALDRVAGRYRDLVQEKTAERTVFALSAPPTVDLFSLRKRFGELARFYDAEYGSASFVPADTQRIVELRVSTTGLLIRDASPLR